MKLIVIILVILTVSACSITSSESNIQTAVAKTLTAQPPTDTPTKTPSLFNWQSLQEKHVGLKLSIYGKIVKVNSTPKYPVIVHFSDQQGTFLIRGSYMGFDFTPNQCIEVKGKIKEDITYLYMDTNDIEVREFDGCY
jgi:uncharacterized protein YdeI (BOF family)